MISEEKLKQNFIKELGDILSFDNEDTEKRNLYNNFLSKYSKALTKNYNEGNEKNATRYLKVMSNTIISSFKEEGILNDQKLENSYNNVIKKLKELEEQEEVEEVEEEEVEEEEEELTNVSEIESLIRANIEINDGKINTEKTYLGSLISGSINALNQETASTNKTNDEKLNTLIEKLENAQEKDITGDNELLDYISRHYAIENNGKFEFLDRTSAQSYLKDYLKGKTVPKFIPLNDTNSPDVLAEGRNIVDVVESYSGLAKLQMLKLHAGNNSFTAELEQDYNRIKDDESTRKDAIQKGLKDRQEGKETKQNIKLNKVLSDKGFQNANSKEEKEKAQKKALSFKLTGVFKSISSGIKKFDDRVQKAFDNTFKSNSANNLAAIGLTTLTLGLISPKIKTSFENPTVNKWVNRGLTVLKYVPTAAILAGVSVVTGGAPAAVIPIAAGGAMGGLKKFFEAVGRKVDPYTQNESKGRHISNNFGTIPQPNSPPLGRNQKNTIVDTKDLNKQRANFNKVNDSGQSNAGSQSLFSNDYRKRNLGDVSANAESKLNIFAVKGKNSGEIIIVSPTDNLILPEGMKQVGEPKAIVDENGFLKGGYAYTFTLDEKFKNVSNIALSGEDLKINNVMPQEAKNNKYISETVKALQGSAEKKVLVDI